MPTHSHSRRTVISRRTFRSRSKSSLRSRSQPHSRSRSRPRKSLRRSRTGKLKILPTPHRGAMGKFGYHNVKFMPESTRHRVLKRAIRAEGHRKVIGHLVLIANYTYKSDPALHAILKSDQQWVSQLYGKLKASRR